MGRSLLGPNELRRPGPEACPCALPPSGEISGRRVQTLVSDVAAGGKESGPQQDGHRGEGVLHGCLWNHETLWVIYMEERRAAKEEGSQAS